MILPQFELYADEPESDTANANAAASKEAVRKAPGDACARRYSLRDREHLLQSPSQQRNERKQDDRQNADVDDRRVS